MRFGGSKKRLLTLVTTTAVLSTVAWQMLPMVTQWNPRKLASQIAQGIKGRDADEVSEPLRRQVVPDTSALSALVFLASSQHASAAHRARQAVEEQFATWLTQAKVDNHFDLATPTTTLASALVSHADRLDSLGKRWAVGLAIRMVDLTESLAAADAEKLLGVCDQIFAAVPPHGPRLRSLPETAQQRLPAAESKLVAPDIRLDVFAMPKEIARDIFSQDLKNRSPEVDIPIVDTRRDHDAIFTEPTPPLTTLEFKPSRRSPEWSTQSKAYEPALAPNSRLAPILLPRTNSLASEVVDIPTPLEMERRQIILRKMSSRVLIAKLAHAGRYEAGSIRVVLRQRGFTETELALAGLLASPHAEDRNQLVEAVSALPAGNARRWLRWLLKDASAEVRLRALTALATTNDPQLFRLAREMAVADQDVRVSELASRIMRQVR